MADLDLVRSGDLALRSGGPVARNVVFREDVFELLDRGREFPVSLVCAPAGYGKSLAVASWLQARGLAATWVALAPRMVSAATAWDAIAAALEHDHQGTVVAAEFAALAHRAPDELPAALAAWLARLPEPTLVVLDDLHLVHAAGLYAQLLELIAAAGSQLRLVVITRHDPPWPLHRMRLQGLLYEIRAGELRFDDRQVVELFRMMDAPLELDEVAMMQRRTQGWVAGLRLAALGARQVADPHAYLAGLSGSDGYIADYLMREVFTGLPGAWQDFLMTVAVVDEVCDDLAIALGAGSDSAEILSDLARLNVFVHELGRRPGWYRLHPLLLDFVRTRVMDRRRIAELNRAAAAWFRRQNEPEVALHHAVLAADWHAAAELVGTHVISWTVRRAPTELLRVLEPVPREAQLSEPGLAIGIATARIMAGRVAGVTGLLAAARARLPGVHGRRRRRYEFLIDLVSAGERRWAGDLDAALAGCRKLPKDPDVLASFGLADWAALRPLVVGSQGMCELWTDDLHHARADLDDAATDALAPPVTVSMLNARAHLAMLHRADGDLTAAGAVADAAVHEFVELGLSSAVQATGAYLALAGVALDRDEIADARRWLDVAAAATAEPCLAVAAGLLDAGVALAEDRSADGRTAVASLVAAGLAVPAGLADTLRQAATLLGVSGRSVGGGASDRFPQVLPAEPGSRRSELAERLAVVCTAGDDENRRRALEEALDLAAPERLRRPFLEEVGTVRELLTELIDRGSAQPEFALDLLNRMTAADRRVTRPERGFYVPLSSRELNVLQHLVSSMTTAEIAQALFVSVNTVKTHQRAIYRKLGVNGRRAAVNRARELDLL